MSKHPLYNTTGLQKNNKSHVLYALANKQMELQQLKEEYSTKIAKIKSDLLALEHTICLFDSDCEETLSKITEKTVKKPQKKYFENGEATKLILSTLRTAGKPVKTDSLVDMLAEKKSLVFQDNKERYAFSKNVSVSLNYIWKKGLIKQIEKIHGVGVWEIAAI